MRTDLNNVLAGPP